MKSLCVICARPCIKIAQDLPPDQHLCHLHKPESVLKRREYNKEWRSTSTGRASLGEAVKRYRAKKAGAS